MFATAGEDVQLWRSSPVQPCLRFDVDKSRVRTVSYLSWSADGRRLASIAQHCDFVNITEFSTIEHTQTQLKVQGPCYCCAFSHNDSGSLGVGLEGGGVQLLRNGKTFYSYKPHKEKVTCVSYNNNGSLVASGAYDGSVALLSLGTKVFRDLSAPTGKAVVGLQWSSQGTFMLVTTSIDGYLCIWDSSARCLRSKHPVHPVIGSSCLSLSPVTTSLAVTAGHDRRLVLYDVLATCELASVATPETFESLAFLPDGLRLVAGGTSGRVYLYDLRKTKETPPSPFDSHSKPVVSVATMWSQETETQMMAFVKASAASVTEAATTPCQPRDDSVLPARSSLGPDVQAAGDVVKTSAPVGGTVWATTKSSGEVFKEAHKLGAPEISSDSPVNIRRGYDFRLSDLLPVLSDSVLDAASDVSLLREEEVRAVKESQADEHRESLRTNEIEGSSQDESAPSSSIPSTSKEGSRDQHVEGAAGAMDSERHLHDCALADLERQSHDRALAGHLHHLEGMLSAQNRYLDRQFRRIDQHITHMHMQLTMLKQSCMRDIQAMLQQVFDAVTKLREEIAELRGDDQ